MTGNFDNSNDAPQKMGGLMAAGARSRTSAAEAAVTTQQEIQSRAGRLIRGVLFDIDGTLYHQTPVRTLMALLLVLCNIHNPLELIRKIRVLKAYRKSQEALRSVTETIDSNLNQIVVTAQKTGESMTYISAIVSEWFERRPLSIVYLSRRRNLRQTLQLLRDRGLQLGVYSDYPAHDKLRALRIADLISVAVSSSDPEVQSLKPNEKGFWVAAKRMNLHPSEIIYVGDRPEVDAAGGCAAGMQVIIIKGRLNTRASHRKYRCCISLSDILNHVGYQGPL